MPNIPGRLKRKGFISPAPPKDAPKEIKVYMADTYAGLRKSKFPGEKKENKMHAARLTWYLTKRKFPDYFRKRNRHLKNPKRTKGKSVKPTVHRQIGSSKESPKCRANLTEDYELQEARIAMIERR